MRKNMHPARGEPDDRVLTGQGAAAPDGAKSHIVDGAMSSPSSAAFLRMRTMRLRPAWQLAKVTASC